MIDEHTPLMRIAGPMFVELFLNILLNNVDTIMLSHYSENAVGTVERLNAFFNDFTKARNIGEKPIFTGFFECA